MDINKKWAFLSACFTALYAFAGSDAGKEKFKMILPIHILLDADAGEDLPEREPNIDYAVYKVGAIWPDWDWADPETLRKEEEILRRKNAQALILASYSPNHAPRLTVTTPVSQPPQLPRSSSLARFCSKIIAYLF
jgi:hypothetical protein